MILLERNGVKPLYIQIYEHIRDEIISGQLREGHRLSATRAQAEKLGVSRNTVEQAYLQLCSEGYLENRRGSGYYVRYVDALLTDRDSAERKMQSFHRQSSSGAQKVLYDMKYGNCHMESFPLAKWRKAVEKALLSEEGRGTFSYGENYGDPALRSYLADYLERDRGVKCSPEQIIIGSGTQFLAGILLQLLRPGRCAIEEPGYDGLRYVLQNHGVTIIPVEAGGCEGIRLDRLSGKRIQAVYVTPSHQFPMGGVMPIQNRIELIRMAEEEDFFIMEDDYDSVFRYTAKAIPAMQGLDQYGRVIYLGSLSKILSPSIRLAYMVLPPVLKNRFDMSFSEYHNTVSGTLQKALRIFMEEGEWERHIRKTRLNSRKKHDILESALESGLGDGFRVTGKDAGVHMIIESSELTAEEMIVRCRRKGINVYSLEKYFALGTGRNRIIAGFGGIALADMEDASRRLVEALKIGTKK